MIRKMKTGITFHTFQRSHLYKKKKETKEEEEENNIFS